MELTVIAVSQVGLFALGVFAITLIADKEKKGSWLAPLLGFLILAGVVYLTFWNVQSWIQVANTPLLS